MNGQYFKHIHLIIGEQEVAKTSNELEKEIKTHLQETDILAKKYRDLVWEKDGFNFILHCARLNQVLQDSAYTLQEFIKLNKTVQTTIVNRLNQFSQSTKTRSNDWAKDETRKNFNQLHDDQNAWKDADNSLQMQYVKKAEKLLQSRYELYNYAKEMSEKLLSEAKNRAEQQKVPLPKPPSPPLPKKPTAAQHKRPLPPTPVTKEVKKTADKPTPPLPPMPKPKFQKSKLTPIKEQITEMQNIRDRFAKQREGRIAHFNSPAPSSMTPVVMSKDGHATTQPAIAGEMKKVVPPTKTKSNKHVGPNQKPSLK